MTSFSMIGKQVFFLKNPDGDYVRDIDKINELRDESILIIDDYSLNFDIIKYIGKFNSEKIKVIFADRSNNHDRLRKPFSDADLRFVEIGIDTLHDDEMEHLVGIIDNLGFWGEKAYLQPQQKMNLIRQENRSQISHTLLNIFNSPQIRNRLEELLLPLTLNNHFKDTVFSICLLEIINLPTTSSLISEVSGNDAIYRYDLRTNNYFSQLFRLESNKIISKSSLFSMTLINNFFSTVYITDMLLKLAEKYDKLKDNGNTEMKLFESLLRFSFAERIIPDKGKLTSLVKYYEELKVRVGWLKFDPHYWLQYGMARISFGELDKAQSNLDEAYVIASHKSNYDTSYMDTQQAKLYILRAIESTTSNMVWDYFYKANTLLDPLKDNVYKYRQVALYKRLYEKKYTLLSKSNKKKFLDAVLKMKKSLESSGYFHPENIFNEYAMDICYRNLSDIVAAINNLNP
jgi:hypothetical protein